jgi:putative tryptophan/tyrosine transport system substrate-binding protein
VGGLAGAWEGSVCQSDASGAESLYVAEPDRLTHRRAFVSLLSAEAIWPLAARAQQSKIPRVGYVSFGSREDNDSSILGLRKGLAERGYILGRDLLIEERYGEGNREKIPTLIAELLTFGVDVLVTFGTPSTLAARRATSAVPIVSVTGDPVGVGLAASLSRPGGNVTGLSLLSIVYSGKWLQLMKAAVPKLGRVAVLWIPDNPGAQLELRTLEESAPSLGLTLARLSAQAQELDASFAAISARSFDGLIVCDDALIAPLIPRIVALVAEARVPALYGFSDAVQKGGLMSYSTDIFEIWRRSAGYVDRILKGAHPGDLPIEQATEIALKINLKTAKALGLDIAPALLAAADEVIE